MSAIEIRKNYWEKALALPEEYTNIVMAYVGNITEEEKAFGYESNYLEKVRLIVSKSIYGSFLSNIYKIHRPVVIYLDVDGVLLKARKRFQDSLFRKFKEQYLKKHCKPRNISDPETHLEFCKFKANNFDSNARDHLRSIFMNFEKVAVVVSSCWRKRFSNLELREIFSQLGGYVIDQTPQIEDQLRGEEIKKHASENQIWRCVILDDNRFFFNSDYWTAIRFVHVKNPSGVLTKNEAIRARGIIRLRTVAI